MEESRCRDRRDCARSCAGPGRSWFRDHQHADAVLAVVLLALGLLGLGRSRVPFRRPCARRDKRGYSFSSFTQRATSPAPTTEKQARTPERHIPSDLDENNRRLGQLKFSDVRAAVDVAQVDAFIAEVRAGPRRTRARPSGHR